jgi:hypothetical protein
MKRLILVPAAALLLLVATGCSMDDDTEGLGDAPVSTVSTGQRGGDDSPADCTNMPDGFGNLCTKCVKGAKPWRAIVTTNTAYSPSSFVAVQDPKACGGDWVPGPRVVSSSTGNGMEEEDDS